MSEEKLQVEIAFLESDSSGRKSVRVKPSKLAISHFYGLWRSNCSFSKYLQIIVPETPRLRNHLITELCQYVFVGRPAKKKSFQTRFCLPHFYPKWFAFDNQATEKQLTFTSIETFKPSVTKLLWPCHHSTFLEKGAPPYGFLALWTSQYHIVLSTKDVHCHIISHLYHKWVHLVPTPRLKSLTLLDCAGHLSPSIHPVCMRDEQRCLWHLSNQNDISCFPTLLFLLIHWFAVKTHPTQFPTSIFEGFMKLTCNFVDFRSSVKYLRSWQAMSMLWGL